MSDKNKCYHFIAIGGVGQSALAKILAIKGFEVSGSDAVESKYTRALSSLGVKVSIGQKKENINENQIIVLSSAIKEDNPELIRAKELNLPLYHRSDILKLISKQYPCFIGFSGTHGKTTTSALCSYILEMSGKHPAYAVGGIVSGLETNAGAAKESEIFVAELDESDGTIVKYSPDYAVINNLEVDHFDFYKNGEDDLIFQFNKFFNNLKETSKVFVNIDDSGVNKLLKTVNGKKIITYSIKDKTSSYSARNIKTEPLFNSFDLYKNDKFLKEIKTSITGIHNVYNALAVAAVLIEKGFDINSIAPYFYDFQGAKRRFEKLYDKNGITVVDDYAHHPTEIKAVLKNAKNRTGNEITAIFQPHRYTRLKALWNDFLNSFEDADRLFVVDTYCAGDKFDSEFNSENFAKEIKHKNCKYIKGDMDEAAVEISKYIKKNDFIITVGAGDVTRIGHTLGGIYEKRGN